MVESKRIIMARVKRSHHRNAVGVYIQWNELKIEPPEFKL